MASFVNSIRNITSDSWWFVKLSVFSTVVFFVLDEGYYNRDNPNYIVVYIITAMLSLGCASILMNRNINNLSPLLPSLLSIPELIIKSIGATLVALPGSLLYALSVNWVYDSFEFEPFVSFVIYLCITLFFSPFIFIPIVLYSVKANFTDAFRFGIIYEASGNFTVQIAGYLLQYIFIMGSATYLLYTVILEMLGDNVGLLILKAVVIVLSFLSVFSFCSDLYQDVIPEIKIKRKKKKGEH